METGVVKDLRTWCGQFNISQAALKGLIPIINNHYGAQLPIDPRTIMKTPRTIQTFKLNEEDSQDPQIPLISMNDLIAAQWTRKGITLIKYKEKNGMYWHQGISSLLVRSFDYITVHTSIRINVNIDGLPLHRSTNKCFWPILINVHDYPNIKPMAVGIFYGEGKPENAALYLRPFVDEMKEVLANGLIINGSKLSVSIRCFILDSPARSFVKG